MKYTITLVFYVFFFIYGFSQSNVVSTLDHLNLKTFTNDSTAAYHFIKETEGKIIIIEFWETWCGPCLKAMPHLAALKKELPEKLQVIAISHDNFAKTKQFIAKQKYPFDFLYDPDKKLNTVFPHASIPYSIIIDQYGKLSAETYPGFISKDIIYKLLHNDSINVPQYKYGITEANDKTNSDALLQFKISRFQLGNQKYITTSKQEHKVKEITGYTAGTYHDTTETITRAVFSGKNILEVYKYALNDLPTTQIEIEEGLENLSSVTPNNLYTIDFASSSLQGDFNSLLINQLNAAMNLCTKVVSKEVEYYELVQITPKVGSIAIVNENNHATSSTTISYKKFAVHASYATPELLAITLTNQLASVHKNAKDYNQINYPVITKLQGTYKIDLDITDESSSLEKWITLLAQHGLKLVKKKGKVTFVYISKEKPLGSFIQQKEIQE
ncbi:TlpA family protein disulfide reductase [Zhouia sp. PK063]|uniref:TlpA family protein disulfide reductase n=1 Tax=Zhouia sp. PK063 TaxID=3373602 RepID=UPI00379C7D21